jgi:hypothetical protein
VKQAKFLSLLLKVEIKVGKDWKFLKYKRKPNQTLGILKAHRR